MLFSLCTYAPDTPLTQCTCILVPQVLYSPNTLFIPYTVHLVIYSSDNLHFNSPVQLFAGSNTLFKDELQFKYLIYRIVWPESEDQYNTQYVSCFSCDIQYATPFITNNI